VLRETCLERGTRLIAVGSDISWQRISSNLSGQSLEVKGMRGCYQLTLPLLGSYQLQNAATAVATLETLDVPKESIEVGLATTYWPGRLQIIRRRPMLVVDGAHSSDSARQLREALGQHFHFDQLILIIGTSADKDISGIVAELAAMADSVIATRSRHPRATMPEAVAGEFARQGLRAEIAGDVAQAVAKAQAKAGKRDLICATGSLFLVGEVIENVKGLRPELYPQ